MSTQVSRRIAAPRGRVYEALLDPQDVAQWRFPSGMTCEVHHFEPFQGGTLRISLTYEAEGGVGKTAGRTDTYCGRFVTIVPNELVVEVDEFETSDPELAGEMTMTIRLEDAQGGGTMLSASHEGLPAGLSSADNEAGWNDALARLAKLVEKADGGDASTFALRPIGLVRSSLLDPAEAPKQGDEGAPAAWIELDGAVAEAMEGLREGQQVILLTWLHRAHRDVLTVHPRNDRARPMQGVFSTRSPARPNPIGLHPVRITAIEGTRLLVEPLEAVDGTPVIDIKPQLDHDPTAR